MFKKWRRFLAKHLSPAEDSIPLRIAITVLVMYALTLTLHELEWPNYWLAVLLMTPAASVMSYHRRRLPNLGIKIFLSLAMIALLFWFLVRLSVTLYDPRLPLAELLIWLQTLHAFDLPAKKDLRYTTLVALILMALASVLTYNTYFALHLLLFSLLFLAVLSIDYWSGNRTRETVLHSLTGRPNPGFDPYWVGRTLATTLPLTLVGAALIFIFMPRFDGLKLKTMPMRLNVALNLERFTDHEIKSPLGREAQDSDGKPQRFDGDSYFGFDSTVNLNARGTLSDRVVLKVRSSNWQYHRGVTFSDYTGSSWNNPPWDPELKSIEDPPFYFPPVNRHDERITIYYAETDLPNVIFTPANPRRLYFPINELFVHDTFEGRSHSKTVRNSPATLISPVYLETGVVYSVLNQVPSSGPAELARTPEVSEERAKQLLEPYLALPDTVSERTINKARELVGDLDTPWLKAARLTNYLQENFTYDREVPFYPEGVDTVDHFVFESGVGHCEQFTTALVVMARSVGVPARYVTGYLPGTYNPISGFYEIKASDAHAWAEIYVNSVGWIIFDPVPGGDPNPEIGDPPKQRWLLESLLEYIGVPVSVREALPNLLRVAIIVVIVGLFAALLIRRRPSLQESPSSFAPYLKRAERLVGPRRPGETVKDWAERLAPYPQLQVLSRVYEERFYQGLPLDDHHRRELESLLLTLEQSPTKRDPNRGSIKNS